jgi:hypothetical protein
LEQKPHNCNVNQKSNKSEYGRRSNVHCFRTCRHLPPLSPPVPWT